MEKEFRCSVIIPTRNCLHFLPKAIASVRAQNIENLEILVVDDKSSDGTWDWLQTEARSDPHLIPIRGEGKGPSIARNNALSKARAPFVAFLDADDSWYPNKLSPQLAYHEAHPEVAFSFTDYMHIDQDGLSHGSCFDFWRPSYIDRATDNFTLIPDPEFELLAANVAGTSTVVASRQLLQNANDFPINMQSAEDWHLWLTLANKSPIAVSAAVKTSYLMHPGSVTSNRDARIFAMREIVNSYRERSEPAARRAMRKADSRIAEAEAEHAREMGKKWDCLRGHWRALILNPQRRLVRSFAADLAALLRV